MEDLVLLDTGVILDFFADRETGSISEALLREGRCAISAITVFELFNGVTNKRHMDQRKEFLKFVECHEISAAIALEASRIFTYLKQRGELIENEDILVAATALKTQSLLFTLNKKHFQRIPGIRLLTT